MEPCKILHVEERRKRKRLTALENFEILKYMSGNLDVLNGVIPKFSSVHNLIVCFIIC